MRWYPGACPVCGGDLHDDIEDEDWLTCFLCARSFRADAVLRGEQPLFAAWGPQPWPPAGWPEPKPATRARPNPAA